MERARLYLDEDVYRGVALGLRRRGFDAVTTVEAGRCGASDEDQLRFAVAQARALFTFNRGHFVRLHGDYQAAGRRRHGIIVCAQAPIGPIVRALAHLLAAHESRHLENRLVWLVVGESRRSRRGVRRGS